MKNLSQEKIDEFFSVIKEKKFTTVFQPIVSLEDGEILGYEALSRITAEKSALSIEDFFDTAEQLGCLWNLEKICRSIAIQSAVHKPNGKKLFLNVDSNVIQDPEFVSGVTKDFLHENGLKTNEVVFEITERHDVDNIDMFQQVMKHYERQGFGIAIDDLGSKYSGLNRINYLKPQYIKVDIELIHNIQNSKSKRSLVSMLVRHCNEMNYTLIAEGIETKEELECLHKLGVPYGQGFYLGKPHVEFLEVERSIKKEILQLNQKEKKKNKKNKVGAISRMGCVLYPDSSALRAYNTFLKYETLTQIAVVDSKNHFYGLINRDSFLNRFKNQNSIIQDSSITDWLCHDSLVLDAKDSLKKAILHTMTRPGTKCYEPFVVLKDNRYYGTVTIRDLLLALSKKKEAID